ncbi:MAG: hypothetical protein NVS3B16_15620 [Vulcanimicrobiaceae bacterium]
MPFVPLAGQPAAPITPVGRGLAAAGGAIDGVRAAEPATAQRAAALYLRAQQQSATGDVAGALASAALARAAALAPAVTAGLAPALPLAAAPAAFASRGVPLAVAGAPLPLELLGAREAIERAAVARHGSGLELAKSRYRRALDALLSGNLAGALDGARAARALAVKSRTKGP